MEAKTSHIANPVLPATRGYQQEMLEESLQRNIIMALDTGSGKTHIAILRLKLEAEREPKKISWFMAPTNALTQQQYRVIKASLPVTVGLISSALAPDQWKDPSLWQTVLESYRIVVSTPQVLLDALRHGYINLGKDIGLLVFDEAHHAVDKHPYNRIMKEFYDPLPRRDGVVSVTGLNIVRPMVIGLTASPIFGGNVEKALRAIEANLDSVICAPQRNREELAVFVHRPVFKHALFPPHVYGSFTPLSRNLTSLSAVLQTIDIEDDPFVRALRRQLGQLPDGVEKRRVDQKLSKTLLKGDSYTHKGLRDFERAASEICEDLGPWAADWYVEKVIQQAKATINPKQSAFSMWQNQEKAYLLEILSRVDVTPVSYDVHDIDAGISPKTQVLINCLSVEHLLAEAENEPYSGLIFVTRRDAVLALTEVLSHHPRTVDVFQLGCLLGNSDNSHRSSFLDITRNLLPQPQDETLEDFRKGDKNLIVSTSVAEEGLDIQACGSVIRWDPPANMTSWAQSRGRARRKKSSFILMFEEGGVHENLVKEWESLELQMIQLYNDVDRQSEPEELEDDCDGRDDELMFRSESTGACVTLHSAVAHLSHFCSVIPHASHVELRPIYDIDPPDLPEGFHLLGYRSNNTPIYHGLYGATVTLPKQVPAKLRVFTTARIYSSKMSARRHVAFEAYVALYKAKLLNEHLLPLTSVLEPDLEEEVKNMLQDVEKRAGTASVSSQIDPWIPLPDDPPLWWQTRIMIDNMPSLDMFTRVQVPTLLLDSECAALHSTDHGTQAVRLQSLGSQLIDDEGLQAARHYTRRLLWGIYGTRMSWDQLDFTHLFARVGSEEDEWEGRRNWASQPLVQSGLHRPEQSFQAKADTFGSQFAFPEDLTIIRDMSTSSKPYQFIRWQFEALSPEEESELLDRYVRLYPEVSICYPLLVVKAFPRRNNFLVPIPKHLGTKKMTGELLLLPQFSTVDMTSFAELQMALFLPSILRFLSVTMTALSFHHTLLSGSELETIPLHLLTTALCAPTAQELTNYQRLETLGDTVLKLISGVQLLAQYPLWHEGYLTQRKTHIVSNVQLAKGATHLGLYRWIIRDRLLVRKWRPQFSKSESSDDPDMAQDSSYTTAEEKPQELSTKVLADVVESLIGVAYLQGRFELAIECARLFDLGFTWHAHTHRLNQLSLVDQLDTYPTNIADVENMLGYRFRNKLHLVEALTHASHQSDFSTMSYERMEFLGDSVLDMVLTDWLYHAPGKNYGPGHLHILRTAVVNLHFLAFICLSCSISMDTAMPLLDTVSGRVRMQTGTQQLYLWQYLLHSSSQILEQQNETFARYEKEHAAIEHALRHGHIFPWAALTRLQAPKFFSDTVESLIGALYLDSRGDMQAATKAIEKLGILPTLRRIVLDDVDVRHPVSRVTMWADKHQKKVQFKTPIENGKIRCSVLVDEKELFYVSVPYRGKASQDEAKFLAAEHAISMLEEGPSIEEDQL